MNSINETYTYRVGESSPGRKVPTNSWCTQLALLIGQLAQGTWRLRVTDLEAKDIGKLNRWALQIERDA